MNTGTGEASQARHKSVAQHTPFAPRIVVSATNQVKARLHQTEPPNAMPTTERCPGHPMDIVGNFFQFSTSGSPSVMNATIPAM